MRIVVVVVVVVVVVLVVVAAIIGDGLADFLDEVGGFTLAMVAVAAGPAGPPVGPGRRRAFVRFVVFLAALATLLYDDFDGVFAFAFVFLFKHPSG
jgi:phosphatidylglycerophosphate synthase